MPHIRHSMKRYLVFGPCLYAATSRLIDIDISQLLRNLLIKRVNFWHMHCSEKKSPLRYSEEEQKNGLATHMGHRT